MAVLLILFLLGVVVDVAPARSPERQVVPVSTTWDVGSGSNVYVVGSHADAGAWNPVSAHKLRWTSGNVWTGQIAVQKGTTLEYKFISRSGASNQYCNGANVTWEAGANRTSVVVAASAAPFSGKTIYYYSSWTNATLVTASSNAYPFTQVGAGRTGGEFLYRVTGVPEEGEGLEFALTGNGAWDKPPVGDGWGAEGNYFTTLDAFLVQDGQLYNYWPSNTVSAPRVETRLVNSSYDPPITARTAYIYLPRGYDSHPWKRYPVIYMQDGQNMADPANPGGTGSWQADATARREISQGRIREVIMVGVANEPTARRSDYNPPSDTYPGESAGRADIYLKFLLNNVRPTLDYNYRTLPDFRNTLVGGSSMGGIFSLYAGFETNVFGGVLAMSPAVTRAPNYKATLASKPKRPLRIYMDTGTDEKQVGTLPGGYYWDDPWSAYDSLLAIGYAPGEDLMMRIGCSHAHNEYAWRTRLPDAFRFLLNVRDDPNAIALAIFPTDLRSVSLAGPGAFPSLQQGSYQLQVCHSLSQQNWTNDGSAVLETRPWGTLAVTSTVTTNVVLWRIVAQPAP